MERRLRPRVTPNKEVLAIIANATTPNTVLDYSAMGISIRLNGRQVLYGRRCRVDLVVGGRLLACGVPGVVRWTSDNMAGINLIPKNGYQTQAVYEVESEIMYA